MEEVPRTPQQPHEEEPIMLPKGDPYPAKSKRPGEAEVIEPEEVVTGFYRERVSEGPDGGSEEEPVVLTEEDAYLARRPGEAEVVEPNDAVIGYSEERFVEEDALRVRGTFRAYDEDIKDYHQEALAQSRNSFWVAISAGLIGLVFFGFSVSIIIIGSLVGVSLVEAGLTAVIPTFAGAIIEVISGINFWTYKQASGQLAKFHLSMIASQDYLLANSIVSEIDKDKRADIRIEIIRSLVKTSEMCAKSFSN